MDTKNVDAILKARASRVPVFMIVLKYKENLFPVVLYLN